MAKCLNHIPELAAYLNEIKEIARKPKPSESNWKSRALVAIDGGPSLELEKRLEVNFRRSSGLFLTPKDLSSKLVSLLPQQPRGIQTCFDPSCGAGDLLIAFAKTLPVKKDLANTVTCWGDHILGCEKYAELATLAKLRLILLAIFRGAMLEDNKLEIERCFPNILIKDGLQEDRLYRKANCLLLNPPFHQIEAPKGCTWASGQVNAAAIFLDTALQKCNPGTRLAAILPDVLRSGTRYTSWRESIPSTCGIGKVELLGEFDAHVDVDVFLISLFHNVDAKSRKFFQVHRSSEKHSGTVGQRFDISIGPVVPFRDKAIGIPRPYIKAKNLPAWCAFQPTTLAITGGRGFQPPFVVIRRTSRPGDKHRAVGTLIVGNREVSVENHLLVLIPRNGSGQICRELLSMLASKKTDKWLDKRIRCRHLTVSAIKELPWWKGK